MAQDFSFREQGFEVTESNFVAIFALLIRQLNLTESEKEKSYLKKMDVFGKKSPPYAFEVSAAIVQMHDLRLELELKVLDHLESKITYSFEPVVAFEMLKRYFAGHLLHIPAQRTAAALVSQNTTVQITPKGTALVQRFYEDLGVALEDMQEVVRSNISTMRLFVFRRSKATSRALYLECFNHILVSQMLGPQPHVWSPSANEKALPMQATNRSYPAARVMVELPFFHRYFLNPESDCHVQYHESGSGLRIFQDKIDKSYSFSGKAFVQWLLDCSTLYSIGEAVAIGQVLLRYGLIAHVTPGGMFSSAREALYSLTPKASCRWPFQCALLPVSSHTWESTLSSSFVCHADEAKKGSDSDSEPENPASLRAVLLDPGLSYLFREHLEREQCVENLDACTQIEEFLQHKKQVHELCRLFLAHEGRKREVLLGAARNLVNKRLFMALQLYGKYFLHNAPCNVNIGFQLQQELDCVFEKGPPGMCDDLQDYMQTPVLDKRMFNEERELNAMEKVVEPLQRAYHVFKRVAGSIYRLMETDSYVNFLLSEQYAQTMHTVRIK